MSSVSPLSPHWTLDHVGIAVADLNRSLAMYRDIFGMEIELQEHVPDHAVDVVFLRSGAASVELIQPLEGNSTLRRFLERRGEGMHHVAFAVENLAAELKVLESRGVALIDKSPRAGSRGCEVAFLHPQSCGGTLVELCQYPHAPEPT